MKKRNFFVIKLAAVTLMLGIFSPSITIEKSETPLNTLSETKSGLSEGLYTKWEGLNVSFSLFTQAEAKKKGHKKRHNKGHRKSNYRHHHGGGNHGYHRQRNNVAGAVVAGVIVGAAVTSASRNSSSRNSCEIVYMHGDRYRDCGNGLYRY